MPEDDVRGVIAKAEDALHSAKTGFDDVSGRPDRNVAGVKNVATYGRAATRVLHQLKSEVNGFEEWWNDYREEMEDDPLLQYFWNLRNEALKEGSNIGWQIQIHKLQIPEDLPPEPEHSEAFFIGDPAGGIGWELELPDGSTEKHYIDPPDHLVDSAPILPDPPSTHLGEDISGEPAEQLCELYVNYIEDCVADARREFIEED